MGGFRNAQPKNGEERINNWEYCERFQILELLAGFRADSGV